MSSLDTDVQLLFKQTKAVFPCSRQTEEDQITEGYTSNVLFLSKCNLGEGGQIEKKKKKKKKHKLCHLRVAPWLT